MKGDVFDLRRLRYFSAIASAGSLSAAARMLNIAQPALSHQMGELERCLGKAVFLRSSRGVELTPIGRLLLEHTEQILKGVANAETALRELESSSRVPAAVRMSLTPSVYDITSALVAQFTVEFPSTRLTVSEDRHRYCYELIHTGKRDLAVTLNDPGWPGERLVCWESMHLVQAPSCREGGSGPIPFGALAEVPQLIVPGVGGPLRAMIDEIARKTGTHLYIGQELQGASARKYAVIDGLGSAIIPWRNVAREVRNGLLHSRQIIDPPLRRELVMHYSRDLHLDFVDSCVAMMKRLLADSDESAVQGFGRP
jgi:LysR family nitrogen assimilation transcriptional regulator